jgi:hypothetical protein
VAAANIDGEDVDVAAEVFGEPGFLGRRRRKRSGEGVTGHFRGLHAGL